MSVDLVRSPLRVICGPTGAGKTRLLLSLAEALAPATRLVAISADSRQLYHGFAIGTAAPTVAERERVPHRIVGTVSPLERFTAAHWAEAARRAIDIAEESGMTPVVVGGTGFYVRSLITPLFDEPDVDVDCRATLRSGVWSRPHEEVQRWAEHLDPGGKAPGRAQRERAIEMALLTGVPMHRWHERSARTSLRAPHYLVVDPGSALSAQLEDRLQAMLRDGWANEVESLLRAGVPIDAPAWQACGYLALRDALTGSRDWEDALDLVRVHTRQYVKRQRTWYRHQLSDGPVTHLDPLCADAVARAVEWWKAAESDPGGAP
jgi:tRNA dimethylallyltransferase